MRHIPCTAAVMIYKVPFGQLGFDFLHIEFIGEPDEILNQLPESGLAMVGTRHPQRRSFDLLEKTIHHLSGSSLILVSGFARGIDSRAHELALEHGLKTVAILGCGLHTDYPKENRFLRKRILESGGMLISPFELHAPALPHHFLNRNQLIAHFSKAVWVVEAAAISGSLNTATHAATQNRDLYATPAFPGDPLYRGNELLLSQISPHRYPVAEAFYGTHSLLKSWPALEIKTHAGSLFKKSSRLQKWVDDLIATEGLCRMQSLMDRALEAGLTPEAFYLAFEQERSAGNLIEGPLGTIDLR